MKPQNLGRQSVMFLSDSLTTGGGASVPPSYPSTYRTRGICAKIAERSWVSAPNGRCWYCGRERKGTLIVDVGDHLWHLGCVEREINRREAEL